MKQKYFIDFHKGITFLYILALINYYDAFNNITIWVYLGLHGTYGILWVMKSLIFPDKSWEQKTNLIYGLIIIFGLSLYWISPWIIVSGYFNNGAVVIVPNWLISIIIFLFGVGVFLHFSSDMQKYTALKINPGHLITDGLFKKSRNINYVGELLIYLSFALLSMHWIPLIVLVIFIISIWIPNMIKKDKSLSRHSDFNKYKSNSRIFL
jgi:steroid 5-alpha reductase family enzyme